MVFLHRLNFLQIVSLKLSSDGIKFLLLISLHVEQLISQFLLLLLQPQDVIFRLRRKPFQSVDRITQFIVLSVELLPQFSNLLLVDVLRRGVLAFECLKLQLVLRLELIELRIFEMFHLLELRLELVQLSQQLLPLVFKLLGVFQLLTRGDLELVLEDLVFLLLLVQQLRKPLVFSKQLRVLLEDHLHFFLQLAHLLALGLQNRIFLFKHDEVGPKQLLDAIRVIIELTADVHY